MWRVHQWWERCFVFSGNRECMTWLLACYWVERDAVYMGREFMAMVGNVSDGGMVDCHWVNRRRGGVGLGVAVIWVPVGGSTRNGHSSDARPFFFEAKPSTVSVANPISWTFQTIFSRNVCRRLRLKCTGTRLETRFRLSAKRTSPFKSAGASVQSTTGSRGVRISGSNAGYTMFRGSVKSTGYPLHSPVSPSLPHPCVTVCHHVSTGLYVLPSTAFVVGSSFFLCWERKSLIYTNF